VDAGPSIEIAVTGVAAGGDGIGRTAGGQVVFVAGAAPGERVRAAVTGQRPDYLRAAVTDILEASPDRVEAPCPHRAAGCGGCPWQVLAPAAQLQWKRDIVADSLRRLAGEHDVEVGAAGAVPPQGYRTTVRVAVDSDGRPAYHQHRDTALVIVDSCLVTHPLLEELIRTSRFPGAREAVLRVSAATGEQTVRCRPARGSQGRSFLHEMVGGRRWRVSATAFFQSGPAAAELLLETVVEMIGDALPMGGRLVDAYAGVGVLGGGLAARRSGSLVAIESHRAAAADARVNLADLDAQVVATEVGRWEPSPGATPVDVVIADPARPGLGRPGVGALLLAQPRRLILVSCDPASLARDARLLSAGGYRLGRVQVLDLSPHTTHVEAVARFDRA
jgi:23S rRNA (uracil1939-C5)-methyltransferase